MTALFFTSLLKYDIHSKVKLYADDNFDKRNPLVFDYCIELVPIRQVSHTKYLGATITSNLSWNNYVQGITNKAIDKLTILYTAICVNALSTSNVVVIRVWCVLL